MSDEQNQTVPVRHTMLSGVGSTTAGTVGGAVKGGVSGWLIATGICAVLGAALFTGGFGLGLGSAMLWQGIGGAALVGGIGAFTVGPFVGMLTGAFGGVKGGTQAAERVSREKGAATMLDAQVAAYQAQAGAAQTNVYTAPLANNDNKYNFPASGSAMNPAASSIQASSAENLGVVDGQQLQRA